MRLYQEKLQYQHDRARILKKFPDAVALAKGQKGNRQIEAWNRGEIPMLLVHPASAGHGLNLQDGGCHLAFFSMTYWSKRLLTACSPLVKSCMGALRKKLRKRWMP